MKQTIALLLITVCCLTVNTQSPPSPESKLTIQYIANEGIEIRSGSTKILLDAIHRSYQPAYAFTPETMLSKIEGARFPYGDVDLILVSHNHLDHFHAETTARHLLNNKGAELISSTQVVDEVKAAAKKLEEYYGSKKTSANQFQSITHKWKDSKLVETNGIKIEFLSLLHANSQLDERYKKIQNLGHIIEIGGRRLLHVGDADMFADNFASFELTKKKIDIAFVPYWFILSKEGKAMMKKQINAKTYVAVHVPPTGQSKMMRDILSAMPNAVVFSQHGEMLNF